MREVAARAAALAAAAAGGWWLRGSPEALLPAAVSGAVWIAAGAAASRSEATRRFARAAGPAGDVLMIAWLLSAAAAWPTDLFLALVVPPCLLAATHGAAAGAAAGLLAAVLQAVAGGLPLWQQALRDAALVGLPAACGGLAEAERRRAVREASALWAGLRSAQLGEYLSWSLFQLREYLISVTSVAGALAHLLPPESGPARDKSERLLKLVAELNAKAGRLLGDRSALTTTGPAGGGAFDLRELAVETLAEARAASGRPEVDASVTADGPLSPVASDRRSLRLCLLALLQNSLEACAARGGGSVSVVLRCREGAAEIEVTDDGGGFPVNEAVFEPILSARPGSGALGLGLPIGRRLAQRLGGDLRVKALPGGTAALLSVPLSRELPRVVNEDSTWAGRRQSV